MIHKTRRGTESRRKTENNAATRRTTVAAGLLLLIIGATACGTGQTQSAGITEPLPTVRGLERPPATRATPGPPPTQRTGVRITGQFEQFQGPDPTSTFERPKTPAPTPTYEILAVTRGPTLTYDASKNPELRYPEKLGPALRKKAEERLAATGVNRQELGLAEAGHAFLMITTETPEDAARVREALVRENSVQWTVRLVRRDGKEFARVEAIVPETAIDRIRGLEGVAEVEGITGEEVVPLVRQGPEPIQRRNRIFVHVGIETTGRDAAAEVAEAMTFHRGRRISNEGEFAYGTVEIEAAIQLSERDDVIRVEITRAQ